MNTDNLEPDSVIQLIPSGALTVVPLDQGETTGAAHNVVALALVLHRDMDTGEEWTDVEPVVVLDGHLHLADALPGDDWKVVPL